MRRAGAIGTLIGLALGVAVLWSCTVDTRSDKLACHVQADCGTSGRICENGYCVVDPSVKLDAAPDSPVCPTACTSCSFPNRSCMITGAGGNVTCPDGWRCTINCPTTGACGMISCTTATSCDVTCSGTGACGNLTCGLGACTESCTGSGACGDTACASSCRCDVTCNPTLGACGVMTCPTHGQHYCATGGSAGEACSSNAFPNCATTCP